MDQMSMALWKRYFSYFKDIKEVFSLFFCQYVLVSAFAVEQKKRAHRVRYKISYNELGFEAETEEDQKFDIYDQISTRILQEYKLPNASVGCVEIVNGPVNGVMRKLPMETRYGDVIDQALLSKIKNSGHHYAEVSRLAIDQGFRYIGRPRKSGFRTPVRGSCAFMAMLFGIQAYAKITNTKYIVMMIEARLWNNVKEMGVPVTFLGKEISHQDQKFPILIDRDEIDDAVPPALRTVCETIEKDIQKLMDLYRGDLEEVVASGGNVVLFSVTSSSDVCDYKYVMVPERTRYNVI